MEILLMYTKVNCLISSHTLCKYYINLHSILGRTKEGVAVAVKLFDKLTSKSKQGPYMRELAIYVKLGATTGNTCQMYGISPILYHGSGAGSFVLVMPVFTYTLGSLRLLRIDISDESLLSIMQQLVCRIYSGIFRSNCYANLLYF